MLQIRAFSFVSVSLRYQKAWKKHQFRLALSTTPSTVLNSAVPQTIESKERSSCEMTTVTLRRTMQSKSFRNGNQLVFTKAILGDPSKVVKQGDLVQVAVSDEKQGKDLVIGYGVYNKKSLYKIRILCHRYLQPKLFSVLTDCDLSSDERMEAILTHQIGQAYQLRRNIFNFPNADTDTYRLINGEGDQLSGLAVDIIGQDHAVVMSSALWSEVHRGIIFDVLTKILPNGVIIHWQKATDRLKKDGYTAITPSKDVEPPNDSLVIAKENGIEYESYPGSSTNQKTGVYCDQRENRLLLAKHCRNKSVLDLCCFHGGFSLHAAKLGGAKSCTGIDTSAAAIAASRANAMRNGVTENVRFLQADITAYLQSTKEQYEVVVLDPPKLAPSAKVLDKARRKYHALNRDAIRVVDDDAGGLLMTCTCSAAMTQEDGGQYFLRMVQSAALAAGKQVTLLSVHGAAPCHTTAPISFPAGAYLTAAMFYVHPVN